MNAKLLKNTLLAIAICVFATPLAAKSKLPETTKDGLQLQHNTKLAAVYLKPGRLSLIDSFETVWLMPARCEKFCAGRREAIRWQSLHRA